MQYNLWQPIRNTDSIPRPSTINMGLYVTHEEVFGGRATISDLIQVLARLNINDVIRTVSLMNNTYCTRLRVAAKFKKIQRALVRDIFSEPNREKIEASVFGTDADYILFHRQQQLYLLRVALTACASQGGMEWNSDALDEFGLACLMVNDLLGPEDDREYEGSFLGAYAAFLPLGELVVDREIFDIIGRAVQLWIDIPEEDALKQSKTYIDFNQVFHEHYGVDIREFLQVVYLLYAQAEMGVQPNGEASGLFVVNRTCFFKALDVSEETTSKCLAIISRPTKEFGNYVNNHSTISRQHDFTALQRYPLIEVEDGMYVIYDKKFLLKFATHGIWWRIEEALTKPKRDDFRSFFGNVFSTYIARALHYVYDNLGKSFSHRLFIEPMFDSTAEVCDALIDANESWVIMEAKGVILTTRAKYSDDFSALKQDIDSKFIGQGAPKGVRQLAHSIKKLVAGQKPKIDADFSRCREIYPVLVAYDSSASGKFLSMYLDEELRKELAKEPNALPTNAPVVRPLTVLSVADIEAFTSIGRRIQLPHLLTKYRMNSKPMEFLQQFIVMEYKSYLKIEESFSMQNYRKLHDSMEVLFRDSPQNRQSREQLQEPSSDLFLGEHNTERSN